MLNHSTGGKSLERTWNKEVSGLKRNERTGEGSKTMESYVHEILDLNVEKGNLKDE